MSFLTKLFNKSKKPAANLITKVSNDYKETNHLSMLRTIIDDDLGYEDIFKYITYKANAKLPDQEGNHKGKISLFVPLDDVLIYSFIPDENLGLFEMPKFREYDIRLDLPEYKTFSYIYVRDYFDEFMNYIDEHFEPILYSTGERTYVDKIMNEIDPNRIFKHRLYQEDCHLYKNIESNMVEYLKDINLFTNRSLKKKILLELSPLNFILSPDNIYQLDKFHPDDFGKEEKDETLNYIIQILEILKNEEDVRQYLINNFNLRQMAINSKLL